MNVIDCICRFLVKRVFNNYFLLLAIDGLLSLIGYVQFAKFDLILLISGLILAIDKFLRKGISWIDVYIIAFSFVIAITSLSNNYPHELWFWGIRYQLLITLFFFVGEHPYMRSWNMFENAKIPFLVVCAIGLGLFLVQPSWYVEYKLSGFTNASENRLLEMTRLSAFWVYPYWVSYGCSILFLYISFKSFYLEGYISKTNMFVLIFLFFVALLTQQRAAIGFISFITFILLYKGLFVKDRKKRKFSKSILLFVGLSTCLILILFSFLDEERIIFMFNKVDVLLSSTNYSGNSFIQDRINLFSDFFYKKVSFFGDGIGRYSHAAYNMGKMAITDQQYMQIFYETGYWGIISYISLFAIVLFKAAKNVDYNIFEIGIVLFFLIAMSGANSLSSNSQHTIIFWICCGRIFNKDCLKYKKTIYQNL